LRAVLKEDYREFPAWFARKGKEEAWVLREKGRLSAFLYLKPEEGPLEDIEPSRPAASRLKAGTLKVEARGTRLGERFIRLILEEALERGVDEVYTTVFEKHAKLVELLKRWGFVDVGAKVSANGVERVLVRSMNPAGRGFYKDYPYIVARDAQKYLLAILPEFHTRLFPDSKLRTEAGEIIRDTAHTNSILKIYIAFSEGAARLRPGDVIVIYRTRDPKARSAWYSSVATSVCVVDKVRAGASFASEEEFVSKCAAYSVFEERELREFWRTRRMALTALRMTYNLALPKRPTRKDLIQTVGLDDKQRWNVVSLTDSEFQTILRLGQADGRLVID
jgi:L-amino acid N-acyltransferase YncA